jgi:hypothetical protein
VPFDMTGLRRRVQPSGAFRIRPTLTPEPVRRAQRLLAAARAKRDAGALNAALGLLVAAEAGPLDALLSAEVEHLRGQIALEQQRGSDAALLLLSAARRLEPLNAELARETHLEALVAAMWAGDGDNAGDVLAAAEAARAAPPGPEPPRAVDVLLDGLAARLTEGYAAAAPTLTRGLELILAPEVGRDEVGRWLGLAGFRPSATVAVELWDAESWHFLAARQVQVARDTGALVQLRLALNFVAGTHLLAGELTTAALMVEPVARRAPHRLDRSERDRVHLTQRHSQRRLASRSRGGCAPPGDDADCARCHHHMTPAALAG